MAAEAPTGKEGQRSNDEKTRAQNGSSVKHWCNSVMVAVQGEDEILYFLQQRSSHVSPLPLHIRFAT